MTEQNSCREGVDICLATTHGATHLAYRAKCSGRRVPLVDEPNGATGPAFQLRPDVTNLDGTWCILARAIEWEAEDEGHGLECVRAANDLRDRRALTRPAKDRAGRCGDVAERIAQCETDATLAVVDSEHATARERGRGEPSRVGGLGARQFAGLGRLRHPRAISAKNSRLLRVRPMRCNRNVIASSLGMLLRKLRSR